MVKWYLSDCHPEREENLPEQNRWVQLQRHRDNQDPRACKRWTSNCPGQLHLQDRVVTETPNSPGPRLKISPLLPAACLPYPNTPVKPPLHPSLRATGLLPLVLLHPDSNKICFHFAWLGGSSNVSNNTFPPNSGIRQDCLLSHLFKIASESSVMEYSKLKRKYIYPDWERRNYFFTTDVTI